MVTTHEGTLTAADGFKLYTKSWESPSDAAKARLVWFHGFNDHCNNYDEFFSGLAESGITVHSIDKRGFGQSVYKPSDKGLTGPTETVLSDMTELVKSLPPSSLPLFLGGHSMGGLETLLWAAKGPPEVRRNVRGYVLEAPFIRLHPTLAPNRLMLMLGQLTARWFPTYQFVQEQPMEWLCRNEQVMKDAVEDPLLHDTATVEGLISSFTRADEMDRGVHDLVDTEDESFSIWCGHGDQDHITSYDGSKDYFERVRVKDKHFETYQGFYHIMHKEPGLDKIRFRNDIVAWIMERATARA